MRKLREISLFEVILCLCVVMIHVLSGCINGYTKGTVLSVASFSLSRSITFAVPAFIMSSAIKMSYKFSDGKIDYLKFMTGRIKKVYLPYLMWSIVYYLYFVFHRNYFPFSIKEMLLYAFNGEIVAPFYFIIVIMQFYFLMPLWIKIFKTLSPKCGILVAVCITVLSKYLTHGMDINNRIFLNYLMFWIMGCYIGSNYSKCVEFILKYKISFLTSAALFTVLYVAMAYMEFMGMFNLFATEIIKLIFCATSSVALLSVCIAVDRKSEWGLTKKIMIFADKLAPTTFYVYLIHCLIIFETDNIGQMLGISSVTILFIIRFFMAYILSFVVSKLYCNMKKYIS